MLSEISLAASGSYEYRSLSNQPWTSGEWSFYNTTKMVSFNHSNWDSSEGDEGGVFLLDRTRYSVASEYCPQNIGGNFRGLMTLLPHPGFVVSEKPKVLSNLELDAKGSTAISRTAPTVPAFSIATSIGELKSDGIPDPPTIQSWKSRSSAASKAGSEYLGVQFGWLPLVADVQNFARTVRQADKIIGQYRRDSGQKIRKRYAFPTVTSSRHLTGAGLAPVPGNAPRGDGTTFRTTESSCWFSGAFKYHVPISDDQSSRMAEHLSYANKLLGVKLTPSVLWELAPWSWAVDWQSNVGDVMTNISALGTDGLVMQYGYMMNRSYEKTEVFGRAASSKGIGVSKEEETLVRRPATPYGFGFDLTSLTAKQTSILLALGLSRGG